MVNKIVDVHSHAFPKDIAKKAIDFISNYYNIQLTLGATLNDVIKSAKRANITKVAIHSTATTPGQVENINNWISQIDNDMVIKFGSLHPEYRQIEKELNRMEKMGIKGIKLHPEFQQFYVNDKNMFEIYEMIQDRFIILFHAGDEVFEYSHPRYLREVIDNFPKLKLIIAHMGGYMRWDEAEKFLVGQNLYFDTSSTLFVLPEARMIDIIRKHGPEKILFGTDYPIIKHKYEVNRFLRLDLTDEEKELIMWKNAYKLLNLELNCLNN